MTALENWTVDPFADAEDELAGPVLARPVPADREAARFHEAAEFTRGRTDIAAKTLALVGIVGVSIVGVARFPDIFPVGDSVRSRLAVAGILGGYAAMAVAVGLLARRLWKATDPVFTTSDPARMGDLRRTERAVVAQLYEERARSSGSPSLLAYETRGHRLARLAESSPDPAHRADLQARADLIRSEVRATQARAALLVIRHRTARALTGVRAFALLLLFALGLAAAGVGADWLDSARSVDARQLQLSQQCAASASGLRAAGLSVTLPASCPAAVSGVAPAVAGASVTMTGRESDAARAGAPTADRERAAALAALSSEYSACMAAAPEGTHASCDAVATLIHQLTAEMKAAAAK